jgi:competence protein ComEC
MALYQKPYFWKQMPFVRLIIPFIAGLLLQTFLNISFYCLLAVAAFASTVLLAFTFLPVSIKYKIRAVIGLVVNVLLFAVAALIVYNSDISHRKDWIGNIKATNVPVLATLQEPLVEKAKTYKAEAVVEAVQVNNQWQAVTGKIFIYFSKDTNAIKLDYGSQVLFVKPLEEIKNAGNPGSFDYKQYNAYQDIYHQLFLKPNEFIVTNTRNENGFKKWLFSVRSWVISTLQQYIPGDKEAGVAEALLIGYRNDLDKDLVQAYSNTGVVHIIAISGLHLGMIYIVLMRFMNIFKNKNCVRWARPILILFVLWIFTFLAGAVPSILRSAVMFSFIILGQIINRKSSIYNTLAASAFVMLCINPYYLFDVGFQLSYAAVVSIIAFARPIHNWFYIKNKSLDFFWQLTSVTLAAQVLTTPVIFYTFHQFPSLFLLTNILIVPLSSVVLFAELILLVSSVFPVVAGFFGCVTDALLHFMNSFIEEISRIPFAVYDGIQNSIVETVFLYGVVTGLSLWLLHKKKNFLFAGLASLFALLVTGAYLNFKLRQQQKVIVYNVPRMPAIDFISGNDCAFVGDTALLNDQYLEKFYVKPSRILHKVALKSNLANLYVGYPFLQFFSKKILIVDKPFKFKNQNKISLDLIVVSRNPRLYISELAAAFDCKQYVFDGSNSSWRIKLWKKDCDSLHLRSHSTVDEGAFVMNVSATE